MNQGDFLICVAAGFFCAGYMSLRWWVEEGRKKERNEGGKDGSLFLFWKEVFGFEIREGRMGRCEGERGKTRTCGGMCSGERGMECILL